MRKGGDGELKKENVEGDEDDNCEESSPLTSWCKFCWHAIQILNKMRAKVVVDLC